MFNYDLVSALSPLAGLAFNSALLTILYRTRPSFGLLKSEYVACIAGAIAVMAINGSILRLHPGQTPANAVAYLFLTLTSYAALGYCHFHFVNLGETARRIRLQRELYHAGGSLSHDELLLRYNAQEIVDKRIRRLINSGQIIHRNDRYFIGNMTIVRIAQFIVKLKRLLLGKTSEHDC